MIQFLKDLCVALTKMILRIIGSFIQPPSFSEENLRTLHVMRPVFSNFYQSQCLALDLQETSHLSHAKFMKNGGWKTTFLLGR